jgi:hypothetical protein
MKISNYYSKKYKLHQRENLFPLYKEHARYLLRVIKTLKDKSMEYDFDFDNFISKIQTFRDVATCHEVAINQYSSLDLATHQNNRGKEREYTNHTSAKGVGRDLRVRLVWDLIIDEIEQDPSLSDYKPYKDLTNLPPSIVCPFCGEVLLEWNRECVGTHYDGTLNYVEELDWENRRWCNCWIADDFEDSSECLDEMYSFLRSLENLADFIENEDLWQSLNLILDEEIDDVWAGNYDYYTLIDNTLEDIFTIERINVDNYDYIFVCEEGQLDVIEYLEEITEAVKYILKVYKIDADKFF